MEQKMKQGMTMKHLIKEALEHIEEHENIHILFAVESGSRAWGFPSPDSDYDVRYVYVRDPKWYISIDTGRDVIDGYHKQPYIVGTKFDDPLLDISGWDLKKAFVLARKANPQLREWMNSPIIYRDTERLALREAIEPVNRLYPAQEHYRAMAKGNFREYLQGDTVRYKKYLYVLRPLLAAQWIRAVGSFPPVDFHSLLGVMSTYGDIHFGEWSVGEVRQAIDDLLAVKSISSEVEDRPPVPALHAFIAHQLNENGIEDEMPTVDRTAHLNKYFRRMLNKYWNE
jgi:hypothetical protein